jgi:HEAT repeat protein
MNELKSELNKVGIYINDIYDLVNTSDPYPAAIPVLLKVLREGIMDVKIKEGIIRALAVKEAVGKVGPALFAEYNSLPKENIMLRWAIGNTIYKTITKKDIEYVLPIVQDKENGISRQMFVVALGKVKSEEAEEVLINLLDDEEVIPHALEALGKMKAKRAFEKITMLTNHSKPLIKKEALKALKKIL